MADNQTGLNAQYDPGTSKFFAAVPAGTGAPGSPGVTASETAGGVIGSPQILVSPYSSSQIAANLPRIDVAAGDTSGMSSDNPVGAVPGVAGTAGYLSTGAGEGSGEHIPHPNAKGAGQ